MQSTTSQSYYTALEIDTVCKSIAQEQEDPHSWRIDVRD